MKIRPGKEPDPRPIKRCAIYTRTSTDHGLEQDFNSLDAQREAGEAYVRARSGEGWTLVPDRYDDGGLSGKDTDRKDFQRLMADVAAGKIDVVIVYKLERFSRSVRDFLESLARLENVGCSFISITQNISTEGAMGRLLLHILIAFAQFERENGAERTRDKIRATRRKGRWTGGRAPLGYLLREKKLIPDEIYAPLICEIFELYFRFSSAVAVARTLNDADRLMPLRVAATGRQCPARPWSKNDILRIVSNGIYAGFMPCGTEMYEGEHKPLIARALFERVHTVLNRQQGDAGGPTRNPAYLLSGVLKCQACGAAMTAASTTKGKRTYRYYRCITRDKRGRSACPTPPVAAEALEIAVVEHLRAQVRTAGFVDEVTAAARRRLAAERQGLTAERQALPQRIAQLAHEGQRLVGALMAAEGGARRLIETRADACTGELSRCELRLARVEQQLASLDEADTDVEWVASVLTDLHRVWYLLTPENRQRLLRGLVARVDTDGRAWRVHLADVGSAAIDPTVSEVEHAAA